ncbi:MAG: hypothetical protein ACTFAK_12230 [Candidatus Electronema sp. VV]
MGGFDMAGRFEGLSDAEWKLFEDIFPGKERKGRGMPAVHQRKIFNSLLLRVPVTGGSSHGILTGH